MTHIVRDNISFITNDNIMPTQFFHEAVVTSGCQKLLVAIFEEALDTLRTTSRVRGHKVDTLWNDATGWVLSDEERYASFAYCCQHLKMEPGRIRTTLRARYGLELRVPWRQPYVRSCIQGHPFSEENTYRKPCGKRCCKTCRQALDRERYRVNGSRK